MKKQFLSLFFTILTAGYYMTAHGQTKLIYFFDKSASVDFSPVKDKCKRVFNDASACCVKGDVEVSSFFIHKNTSMAPASFVASFKPFRPPANSSTAEINAGMVKYNKDNRIKVEKLKQRLNQDLVLRNSKLTSNQTDIWGIFEVASEQFAANSKVKLIYLFSDMVHDSDGVKILPKSKQDAIELARKHKSIILNNFNVEPKNLNGAKVKVVLPFTAVAATGNKFLDYYWKELFNLFGMEVEII